MLSIPHVLQNVPASRIIETGRESLMKSNQSDRLRAARKAIYTSASEAARAMGVKIPTYTHHENGTRAYGEADARLYARRLRTTAEWLLLGIDHDAGKALPESVREINIRAGAGGGGLSAETMVRSINGIVVADELVRDLWKIPDSFLRGELRMRAGSAWIIEIQGDSGYDPSHPGAPGSIFPGDRVIVDTADTRPSPPGPFAVFDGVGLVVKLVEVIHNSEPVRLKLSSRNPSYNSYEVIEGEASIIGRVRGRISVM